MDNIAPLVCATVGVCAGLLAFAFRPTEGPMILAIVSPLVALCGTAWQANRSQKPGA
jgi:hypothetical protein